MYYQYKEFALCGTGNFTPNNTVPFSTTKFFKFLSNNLTDRMLSRDV